MTAYKIWRDAEIPWKPLMYKLITLSVLVISGCVAHIPMEEQSPDLPYLDEDTIIISVIDEREKTRGGIEPDEIGRAHGVFGIPTAMKVYPWFESDRNKKETTLARALEERIVFGLNDEGWNAIGAEYENEPTGQERRDSLADSSAENLVMLILKDWYVAINMNWVSAFSFDWDIVLKVFDSEGVLILEQPSSGKDVVDEQANDSIPNQIRRAYRERLVKILETPEIQNALARGAPSLIEESKLNNLSD
jgi:hypothetical protein